MLPNPLSSSRMPAPKLRRLFASFLPVLACLHFAAAAFGGEFVVFSKTYVRGTGAPETVTDTFDVLNAGTIWTMQVENGSLEDDAVERVSSSTITMNGVELLHESEFNQNVEALQLDVNVLASNTIAVELRGKPGGRLIVKIVGEDNVAPTVQWDAPLQDEFTNEDLVAASLSLADDISGLDPATLEIQLDGTSVAEAFSSLSDPTLEATLLADLVIGEGLHSLSGQVRDLAGQLASASVSFTVDRTAPVIAEVSPPDGATVDTAQPTISASFGDPLSGIDVTSVRLILDGTDVTAQAVVTEASVSFIPDADLADGTHTAEIQVADRTGNLATAGTTFTIVTLSVAISDPDNLTVTNADSVDVTGEVSGAALVTVNGVQASVVAGTFVASDVALAEGTNVLVATAENEVGDTASDTVSIRRDTTPPVVVIESPRGGDRLVTEVVTVAGTVNDIIPGATTNADDVTVTVNGLPAAVNNRTFILPDLPLALGDNTITAVAVDRVGNTKTSSIEVTREPDLAGIQIIITGGNAQRGPINSMLASPLSVRLQDTDAFPFPNRPVTFEVSRGDGRLDDPLENVRLITLLTDGDGDGAMDFTLGSRTGEGLHRVRVTTPGSLTFAEFCATAEPAAPVNIAINAMPHRQGIAGQTLPIPLSVIVTDRGGNPTPGVAVTFNVEFGGGNFSGAGSAIALTNPDGVAEAEWTLGPDEGVINNEATATFDGNPGFPATFVTSAVVTGSIAATEVSGFVQDSTGQPLDGVQAVIRGTELQTFTGTDGKFTLFGVTPGGHRVGILGSSAIDPDNGIFFPDIDFAIEVIAGVDNILDQVVVLPFLDRPGAQVVGGDEDIVLRMADVPDFGVRVFAHSTFLHDPDTGELFQRPIEMTSSQVKFDKVPMAPPQGSTPLVVGTLQPPGVTFDPPAQVTYPNVEGLPPGDVADMFAFHHDIGQFVNIGPGTVSEDGSVVVSDPGFGIVQSGWHCLIRRPGPAANCENCDCDVCERCVGGNCVARCQDICERCEDGNCVSLCDTANCETCKDGACESTCKEDCEECMDGKCESIVDLAGDITLAPIEINFTALKKLLDVASAIGGAGPCSTTPPGELKFQISVTQFQDCCDGAATDLLKFAGTFNVGLGSAKCDFPFLGVPGVASLNVRVGAGASVAFSLDGRETCESAQVCGTVGVSGDVSGGISGTVLGGLLLDCDLLLKITGVGGTGSYCIDSGGSAQLCIGSVDIVGTCTELTFITQSVSVNLAKGICSDTLTF